MRILISLILLVSALSTTACAGVTEFLLGKNQADSWYVKASLYEQDGNLEEAARLLEVVLESVNDEYVYLKLANVYSQLQDAEMIKFTLERAVRKVPESAMLTGALADFYRADQSTVEQSFALYQKAYEISGNPAYAEGEAIAHAVTKDYNSAIKIYDELIKTDPKSDYYVQRARFYEKLGLEKEALRDYKKSADMDGNFAAAAKLSDHYVNAGDNENAIKYLHMVIKASPELTIAKFRLAELLRKIGKGQEAVQYYSDIIDSLDEKEKIYVLKQLGSISFENKNLDDAEEYFTRAYEITEDIQTAYSIALLAESKEENDTAMLWYERILKQRPDFVEASKRLAIIHLKEGRPQEALDALSKVEDIYQDVDFIRIKGQIYVDMGDLDGAAAMLEKAVKDNPAEVKLYLDLAFAVDRTKDKERAEEVIKDGLRYFPEDPSLLNFLGYLYAEQGKNLAEAEKMIKKALDQKPDEPAYLDSLAWVFYQQGKYKEALPLQKRALKGAPDEEEIREHMRAILKKLGIRKSLDDIISED